ncbi:helix-turn-helix domain-containing protein [Aeromicrobium sp.]|uniref:TetR/AcrR family transcriptional regulator n=1 Tax=Aeromicrobium sp. TaxID=1871063 RepID=UPI0030BDBD9A
MTARAAESPAGSRAAHLGPELRRPLVLDAARAVWIERGYRGTTMALIAAEAKVSKPVLYACYADKHEVLQALLDREEKLLIAAAQSALPDELDVGDVELMMTSAYEAFFTAAVDNPASWLVVFEAQQLINDEIAERIRRGRTLVGNQVTFLVSHYFASVSQPLDDREAQMIAESLLALAETHAARLLRHGDGDNWTITELAASVTRFVLRSWPISEA